MQYAYSLSAKAPFVRKFVAGETIVAGIAVAASVGTEPGVQGHDEVEGGPPMVGVSVSASETYSTTQSSDGSDIEAEVEVVINPDAVFRGRMSGGNTGGTDLVLYTVNSADTAGTAVNADTATAGAKEEGVIWGYSGSNAGLKRKITADDDSGVTTVTVPFHDTVVGDTFLIAGVFLGGDNIGCMVTGDFLEFDVETDILATATAADYQIVGWELRDISGEGRSNSWIHAILADHLYRGDLTGAA